MVDPETGPDEPSTDADATDPVEDAWADDAWADEPSTNADPTDADAIGGVDDADDAWADEPVAGAPSEADADAQRKRYVLMAQIGLVVLSLIIVAIVLVTNGKDSDSSKSDDKTTTTVEGSADGKDSEKAAWPKAVEGRPPTLGKRGQTADKVDASKAKPGVYVWSDFDGWHMWVVGGKGMPERLTGTLTSNDELSRADVVTPDTGTVDIKGQEATFDLDTTKGLTGLDFSTGFFGRRLVFTFEGPDGPIDTRLIVTGSKSTPSTYPLVIDKS